MFNNGVRAIMASQPVGTCKIGMDPMAVVDDQLRVRGLAGLRVADGVTVELSWKT